MHQDTATVTELVTAMRSGALNLDAVLAALGKRAAVPDAEYRDGVATLSHLQRQQLLDDVTVTTLMHRLDALRNRTPPAPSPTAAPPADDDATVVMPRRPIAPIEDDITRVQPAQPLPGEVPSLTSLGLATQTGVGTHTGTGTAGTASLSSWQHLAEAAGGDHAGVGSLLKGRFLLERELGRGGMGVVYLARDERKVEARDRDPWLAVKVLSDEFRRHPDALVALQREARRSQKLAHDNIVRVYDFDKDRTLVFMTMEYIDGSDLKTLIREQAYHGMPLKQAWPLIDGMGRALIRAHAAGVVHSDFKPGNVMVTRDGVAKVFDFGIARAGKHAADVSGEQTVFDAATLGALTPAYASLEMIRGQAPTPADDLYALGCVCFELLTGKHPFDKLSAEVALRDGRRPPPVPGLTRRQYATLCAAVAFPATHRLKRVDQLLDGLRQVPLRERALPMLGYGATALAVLGVGGWGASRYLHQRHLDEVIARFSAQDPQQYRDESQAMQALSSLSADDRRRVLMDRSDLIEDFLLRRLDALWNPANGRDDYRGALQVFALRDRLRLYSPSLDARRQAIEREKNERLNALDTTLNRQLDAGLLFRNQPDNALATLDQVRRIDPGSSLLRHSALEVRLDAAIAEAVAAGQLTTARTEVEQASAAFPESLRLQLRSAEVGVAEQQATRTPVAAAPRDADSARKALAADLANPRTDPAWRARIDAELAALPAAERSSQGTALADAISAAVSAQSDPAQLASAQALVEFGLGLVPQSASLLAQRTRLQTLEQQLEQALARESAEAELAGRIESLRRAAAANDLDKTGDALARIRTLQPTHPLLRSEGPQLLSQVYRNNAGDAFAQGRYAQAADLLAQGVQTLGQRAELRSAHTRYAVVAAVMTAAVMTAATLPASERQQLAQRLQALYRSDGTAMAQLETQMKAAGQLPEGSLSARLQRAPVGDAPASDSVPAGNTTDATAPTSTTKPPRSKSTARPGTATTGTARGATAAAAVPASADDDASLPPVPTGPDPCGGAGLPGRGAACFDTLGDTRGPMLVVVPGIDGGKPYALSRGEVAVADFNLFCQATGRCTAQAASTPELARAPVRNISLTQARAYLRWLTIGSGGWRYRLPSDAEWLHAAQAAANWRQAEDSNCVPPTASAAEAVRAPVSARGRDANPWGLINLTGNVWEWVSSGAGVQARGGSFASYWSDCTVQASRADNGSAQPDVGLRVLRELP
ncbi:bifunctional serine/threonine-protein kinase/formylglycine-generating enzyme family protein [Xanthomonas vesicatoria]|uniref:Protein kinase n=3 Tax=Xanthomonas vesicatoria TaxID=56460 RepID=A0ABS8LB47_9XANT|nr:bifunctional serine/threonine-protein kinase/formylglycine-generating enzyme family protein [Xanthomonas vesicatoria]APO95607.1 protein kinase [Xanthomonas vesicatoria]KHM94095.1 protein kinase [Xanthomonas vesicatoria]MCC8622975.1 protein kinase [Xanthomonas vesicatoria]MCC8695187.1 protein kinase [Xanthomonas vesicatoria]MCC8700869.1 protein kinase [Xanthomonas vesicatoria]